MFLSNLRLIYRQFRSIYSLINLAGLTVGFSAFILIYLWVNEELSYDTFHPSYQNIYRMVGTEVQEKGESYEIALTPAPLAEYLASNFEEIESVCRLRQTEFFIRYQDGGFYQVGLAADPTFFEVFSFSLEKGSTADLKLSSDKIIISKKMATAYFGEADPLGKMFLIAGRDVMVAGVMERAPSNSHLQFDYVLPLKFLETSGIDQLVNWEYFQLHTYIKTKDHVNPLALEGKTKKTIIKNAPKATTELSLQLLSDIHLKSSHLNNEMSGRGNVIYVYLFSAIAFFILVVACINYSNLATARSIKRAKETGVRKVVGANRLQLALFFFSESLFYCVLALGLALFISWSLLPYFNELSGKQLDFRFFTPEIFGPVLLSVLMCAIAGGLYPTLLLSRQNPVIAIKGMTVGGQAVTIRRLLVVIQFVLSIGLLTATFIIRDQMTFIQSRDLGYEKENVIAFTALRKVRAQYQTFKNELLGLPEVKHVTANNESISAVDYWTENIEWEGKKPDTHIRFYQLTVDHDFLKTYSISLMNGRDFDEAIASDSLAILVNEEAVTQMGLPDPLNKELTLHDKKYHIIGVMKNFHFKSVHSPIAPAVMYIEPSGYFQFSVKLNKGPVAQQVNAVQAIAKKFAPERPFDYTFVDETVAKLYATEIRTASIVNYLSVLAIFVSCLGLLGIILFVSEQRARELAIRKTLGAGVGQLMMMLSVEYLVMILLGLFLSVPLMYYVMDRWLDNFAYRIDLSGLIFIKAGLIVLLLAWLTIAYRTYKSATRNPVDSLRSE